MIPSDRLRSFESFNCKANQIFRRFHISCFFDGKWNDYIGNWWDWLSWISFDGFPNGNEIGSLWRGWWNYYTPCFPQTNFYSPSSNIFSSSHSSCSSPSPSHSPFSQNPSVLTILCSSSIISRVHSPPLLCWCECDDVCHFMRRLSIVGRRSFI